MAEGERSQYVKGASKLQAVPKEVFVKFEDPEWQIPGTPEKGVYPIRAWNRTWFLDAGRKDKKKVMACVATKCPWRQPSR